MERAAKIGIVTGYGDGLSILIKRSPALRSLSCLLG
ncbi:MULTISPECIES: hypothetical protein [Paenibacillus]